MSKEKTAEDIFGTDDFFGDVKEIVKKKNVIEIPEEGWNDYVLSLFTEDEKINGLPIVAGLRRVAEKILGRIVRSYPKQVWPVHSIDSIIATVVWEIEFENGEIYSNVADCWHGNTDDTFLPFATATAATRAEGRALRTALRLKTCAAEEMTKKDTAAVAKEVLVKQTKTTQGEYNETAPMTNAQLNLINIKCNQMDIDIIKLFKHLGYTKNKPITDAKGVDKKMASAAIEMLNDFQKKDGTPIPDEIIGYNHNWKEN